MYKQHVPAISAAMHDSPELFMRGVLFAVCSIRQPVTAVPEQLEQVDKGDLEPLFGHKLLAYHYLLDHSVELWRDVRASVTNGNRIAVLCRTPGLGIVKSAFALQCMGYDLACLDTRNVKREGRHPRAFRTDGHKTGLAFIRKIDRYCRETEGKAEYYWDTWCEQMAGVYRMEPDAVSALHLAIVPDNFVPF